MTNPIFFAGLILAVLGGIFFGLFSCGGYVWHRQAFHSAFIGALALALVLPPYSVKRVCVKVLGAVAIVAVFSVTEASAAAFYPDAPSSWAEFVRSFLFHLENGPC